MNSTAKAREKAASSSEREKYDAYAALRSMPEYRSLSEKDKKAVRELVDKELKLFRARASSVDQRGRLRREKAARVPDWMPAELAREAMEARQ